jgi:uncharacterized protein (TIGR03084 family)
MDESRDRLEQAVADLAAEQDELDRVVAGLTAAQWGLATPSPGWSVLDQIAHLMYFDEAAVLALGDPDGFVTRRTELVRALRNDPDRTAMDSTLTAGRAMSPDELLRSWRLGRSRLAASAGALTGDVRVPWYGPSMGATSFVTARLMECWAHGQDVVDAVGASRLSTDRLVHIAQLGVITRRWSYTVRGAEMPAVDVRVELELPSGGSRAWGAADAAERVTGPLEDFCLVVTQRRHPEDTALVAQGAAAAEWLRVAQVFAGGPTDGPARPLG